jgi:hypothetical protein
MDLFKQLERMQEVKPVRQIQEIAKISGKEDNRKFPYQNTCKKTTGEYFATINDKIKVIIFYYESF